MNSLQSDLQALQAEQRRGELFVNAQRDGGDFNDEEAGDKMIGEMNRLQDKTQESLDTTKNLIAASKDVGLSTIEELYRQREQLEQIDQDVDRLEDNLKRADKLLKTFGRRMATDKFIQCFACINVMLLVGVIIYTIVSKGKLPTVDDVAAPQSPV